MHLIKEVCEIMNNDFYQNELYHYGVKGMKWGVRRYMNADGSLTSAGRKKYGDNEYGKTKLAVKSAKKEYNKSFNKAYNYSTTPRFTKKGKAERDRRWEDTYDKLDKLDKAKADYKQAKSERRANINKTHREINDRASVADRLIFNDATRKKAAKYVVDKNMKVDDAIKKANKDALRNTAVLIGAYSAVAVATLYKNR